jgi:glutamate dehydrogenase (NADP+)
LPRLRLGNVAIYAIEKIQEEFGGKVVACSDSGGVIYDEKGLDLETLKHIKLEEGGRISEYADTHEHAKYEEDGKYLGDPLRRGPPLRHSERARRGRRRDIN